MITLVDGAKHIGGLAGVASFLLAVKAIAESQNWALALLMLMVGAFVWWNYRHMKAQEAAIADCRKEHRHCKEDVHELRQKVRKLYVAIAVYVGEAGKQPVKKERRRKLAPLQLLLGDDTDEALAEAHRVLKEANGG